MLKPTFSRRNLLRKYPDFPDMRAALAAALWAKGDGGEAETNWLRVEDPRWGAPLLHSLTPVHKLMCTDGSQIRHHTAALSDI